MPHYLILWGALYGVLIAVEKLTTLPRRVDSSRVFRFFYQPFTLLMVLLGWVLFRSETLAASCKYLKTMFFGGVQGATMENAGFELRELSGVLLCGVICAIPLVPVVSSWLLKRHARWEGVFASIGWSWQLLLFMASVSFLVMSAHNPFIYFNF